MVKPNPKYLMQADMKQKNIVMEWLRNSKMAKTGVVTATIAAALGVGGMLKTLAESSRNEQPIENRAPIPTPESLSVPTAEDAFGYSDPNEFVETDEERDIRETEEEFLRIERGEYVHGDAGMKRNYKLGTGAPQMTDEDYQHIYEAKSKVGTGMSMEEVDQLGYDLAQRAGVSAEQYEQMQEKAKQSVESQENAKQLVKSLKSKKGIDITPMVKSYHR